MSLRPCRSLHICGVEWFVVRCQTDEFADFRRNGDMHGLTWRRYQRIYINTDKTPLEQRKALAHELLHLIWTSCPMPLALEESFVTMLEDPFFELLESFGVAWPE